MKQLQKIAANIGTIAMIFAFNSYAQEDVSQRELSTVLSRAVAGVNAETPMALDQETRLDYASTARNFMIYNNTMVNYNANQIDPMVFSENIKNLVLKPLCQNESLRVFKQLKVTLIYRYLGKDGEFIAELSKDMSQCD